MSAATFPLSTTATATATAAAMSDEHHHQQIQQQSQQQQQPEQKPSKKTFLVNSRDNSDYKWQRARGVVGALEVVSVPVFKYKDDMTPRYVQGRELVFQDALQVWGDQKCRESFIQACETMPVGTCCCGFVNDDDTTIKEFVPLLNENWAKSVNKRLQERGFKVECFLWNWQNASGKAETNILLIRFYELSSYRLRRASRDSLDFGLAGETDIIEQISSEIAIETTRSGGRNSKNQL